MALGTLDLEFVGNASGLQDAVNASQRALIALERETRTVSNSLGRILRTIVAPIAGVILSAFAAKQALADFTNSGLPGAAAFAGAMARMRGSMRRLSESVGELLAPVAQRTALIISAIADRMAPLVRILTAFIASSGPFLKQLGENILNAFRPLLPTVFGFFDRIIALWNSIDWDTAADSLRNAWNTAWAAILEFAAPIMIALSSLVETFISVASTGFQMLVGWLESVLPSSATAASAINTVVEVIQFGLLAAIAAVEVALQNLPMIWDLVKTAGLLAFEVLMNNWRGFGQFALETLRVVGENLLTILNNAGTALQPVFDAIGENIRAVFDSVWNYVLQNAILMFSKLAIEIDFLIRKAIVSAVNTMLDSNFGLANLLPRLTDPVKKSTAALPQSVPFQSPNFRGLPAPDLSNLGAGTAGLPGFSPAGSAEQDRLTASLEGIKTQLSGIFGAGIGASIADALAKSPDLIKKIGAGLPGVNAVPTPANLGPQTAGAALQFGTAAAFSAENARKNPLEEKADKQIALTQQQLVEQRAARRAAERKFRIASI